MENVYNKLDDLISYIKNTSDYRSIIKLRKQMDDNDELKSLIREVKSLQKQYIKSGYDDKIKATLEEKVSMLENIPIYNMYNRSLVRVNEMIDYVRDSFNEYFFSLLNEKE